MSATNSLENTVLEHILNNANIANIGDATGLRGSSAAGNLYLSLHIADPDEGGSQTTSEVTYTSYARVAMPRDGTAWTVTANSAAGDQQSFPPGTGGSGTATHWGLGTDASGAGTLLFKGAISPTIACGNGVTPRVTPTITAE
jgi:hypothetical protein